MEGNIIAKADALVEKLNQNAFKGHFGVHWVERDDIIEYYVSGAMDAVDSAIFELEHFLNEKVISKFADENVWGFVCTSSAYRKICKHDDLFKPKFAEIKDDVVEKHFGIRPTKKRLRYVVMGYKNSDTPICYRI